MIHRNIGNIERVVRFLFAVIIVSWVVTGDRFGIAQGIGVLAAFALLWNSIFARCYLWKWLNISSCARDSNDCSSGGGGAGPSQA